MCNEQSSAGNSKAASLVTVVSCYLSTERQIFTVEKPDLFATLSKNLTSGVGNGGALLHD